MFSRILVFLALIVVLISTAALLAIAASFVQDNHSVTLSGLSGVYVVIENLDFDAKLSGLNKDKLRKQVEETLTQAAIPVLSETQMLKSPGAPFLYVIINTFRDEKALLYAFHVRAELRQTVRLDRNPSITSTSATWQSSEPTGLIPQDQIRLLSAAVDKCANEFTVAYLKANQR